MRASDAHGKPLTDILADLGHVAEGVATARELEIFRLADEEFTIGSPQQLSRILFEKLGL